MHVLKVLFDIFCHEKDCNSRIYGGVSHFPHINLVPQSSDTSDSSRSTLTKLDFDQTPGRRGQQEATRPEGIVQDTVKMFAGQRALLPHLFLTRASRPRPHRLSFGATEHDNLNGRETNLTMWVKPARIRHGSHQIINESHYTLRSSGKTEPQKARPAFRDRLTSKLRTQAGFRIDQDQFQQHRLVTGFFNMSAQDQFAPQNFRFAAHETPQQNL